MSNVVRSSSKVLSVRAAGGVRLGGMRPDLDPTALDSTDFVYLENVRRVGGLITSRGGQEAFVSLDEEATGMVDFQTGDPSTSLFLTADDLYKVNADGDPKLVKIHDVNTMLEEPVNSTTDRALIESSGEVPGVQGYLLGDIVASSPASLSLLSLPETASGLKVQVPTPRAVISLPVMGGITYNAITVRMACNAYVFIGASGQDGSSNNFASIFRYDGKTLVREYHVAQNGTNIRWTAGALFRSTIVMSGYDAAGSPQLVIRGEDGTWTAVSSPVKADRSGFVSFQDKLYFTKYRQLADDNIYSFDGTTVSTIAPATTGIDSAANVIVRSLAVFSGKLYFTWTRDLDKVNVGMFDGTTWDGVHKDLLAQFPDIGFTAYFPMVAYNGNLAVGADETATFGVPILLQSVGSDTSGDWTRTVLSETLTNTYPRYLEVK